MKFQRRKLPDNIGQNICGLFQLLAQFSSTTSETGQNYDEKNVNSQVALGN